MFEANVSDSKGMHIHTSKSEGAMVQRNMSNVSALDDQGEQNTMA